MAGDSTCDSAASTLGSTLEATEAGVAASVAADEDDGEGDVDFRPPHPNKDDTGPLSRSQARGPRSDYLTAGAAGTAGDAGTAGPAGLTSAAFVSPGLAA
jgi:hypothetical protein